MQQNYHNFHSLEHGNSSPFSSETADNIAVVAAIENKEENHVENICLEKIMETIMKKYQLYLEQHHPKVVQKVQGILEALQLSCSVSEYIFDSVEAQQEQSEFWEVFQHIKAFTTPFTK